MITDSFDNLSEAIINPTINKDAPKVDVCIITFSNVIEQFVIKKYNCKPMASFRFVTGDTTIWRIDYNGKVFAFFKTYVGAPACVGSVEDTLSTISTND